MLCQSFLYTTKCNVVVNAIRAVHKNHYEVLNLDRNCTPKEIRAAFLTLSKKYHPDKSSDTDSHNKYVKIVEAYSVLSKPTSRVNYDLGLQNAYRQNYPNYHQHAYWNGRDSRERMYYRDFEDQFYNPYRHQYSGEPRGINKLSHVQKHWMVAICVFFLCIGSYLQYISIRATLKPSIYRDKEYLKKQNPAYARYIEEVERFHRERRT